MTEKEVEEDYLLMMNSKEIIPIRDLYIKCGGIYEDGRLAFTFNKQ